MAQTLRLPLAVAPGAGFLTLEQDSDAEIAQSVGLLLATTPGERRSVPDYGLPNPLGSGLDVETVIDVVAEWEERADPVFVEELAAGAQQRLGIYPRSPVPVDSTPPAAPLVNGLRYTLGVGIDEDGRPFIDPELTDREFALKVDPAGRPFVESNPEPAALSVGVDEDDRPFYEPTP